MDYLICRAMCERKVYDRLHDQIPKSMLAPDTVALLGWIQLYYSTYTDSNAVQWDAMQTLLGMRGQHLQKEQMDILKHMLKQVQQVPDEAAAGVVRTLNEMAYSGEMAALVQQYQDGAEIDFIAEAKQLERKYSSVATAQDSLLQWENGSIDDILAAVNEEGGLKLRMFKQFEDSIRGLRGGDCIAVCAPVNAGKTSFVAGMVADLAEQIKDDTEKYGQRPLVWLVNEGPTQSTVARFYQATTHLTLHDVVELHRQGQFLPKYLAKVGSTDRVRIKGAHTITMPQIATIVEEMRPAVLVVDMVANVRGGTADSEHQNLEARWQELRILACEYDCIIIGTMQMSKEGYDMLYPPLTAMKESKIGVQGALDLCIMMGRLDPSTRPDMVDVRGISTPKSKLARSGHPDYLQFQVEFNGGRCQFNAGTLA